jgi:hypothetical protein
LLIGTILSKNITPFTLKAFTELLKSRKTYSTWCIPSIKITSNVLVLDLKNSSLVFLIISGDIHTELGSTPIFLEVFILENVYPCSIPISK